MGFYDLNFESYETYIGIGQKKMSAYDGGYKPEIKATSQRKINRDLGFDIRVAMPDSDEEFKELGIERNEEVKAKSFMVFTIQDWDEKDFP